MTSSGFEGRATTLYGIRLFTYCFEAPAKGHERETLAGASGVASLYSRIPYESWDEPVRSIERCTRWPFLTALKTPPLRSFAFLGVKLGGLFC